MRKMPDGMRNNGKYYPSLQSMGMVETDELCKMATHGMTFTAAEVKACIGTLAHALAFYTGRGYSVRVDGLGVFRPIARVKKDFEAELADGKTHRNSQSLEIGRLAFRAEKELMREVNERDSLERVMPRKAREEDLPLPEEERRAVLMDYLEAHPFITVWRYARLTRLNQTAAQRELRRLAGAENPIIGFQGRAPHRVYVKA